MTHPALWILILPLLGALATALLPKRWVPVAGVVAALGAPVAALALAIRVHDDGVVRIPLATVAGLRWDLSADGMAAVLLVTAAVVNALVSLYATATPDVAGEGGAFWPRWLLLSAAMFTVLLSPNVFVLYVAFEMVGVCAVALVVLDGSRAALASGMRYLLSAFGGSILYLVGVVLIYAESGTLDLHMMAEQVPANATTGVALALMTVGLLLTAALFPLHFWLPTAHSIAPSPASPILSALVIKVSYYAVIVLWFQALPHLVTPAATLLIAGLGAGAIVWGSLSAMRQQRLKRLVAYSTVAQMGYLFLIPAMLVQAAPGATPETAAWYGWHGGVYYAVAHSMAKAAMLMAAGALAQAVGTDQLDDLRGAASRFPISVFAFGIAGLSLVGLPPSGGFVGKWYLLTASLASGQWWIAAVVLGGSGLTAGYLMLVLRRTFLRVERMPVAPLPKRLEVTALVLAVATIALGFRATEIIEVLEVGTPFPAGGG